MTSLSTHVLDSAAGGPCAGVEVTLATADGTEVATATTGADGRIADLAADLAPGQYRLTWTTGGTFVSEVAVTVSLGEDRHYHVPLLASPVSAVVYLGA